MYKKSIFTMLFLSFLLAASACSEAAVDIPGGILTVQISGAQDSAANVIIVFDTDAAVMSGNETTVRFSLDGYWSSPGNAELVRTWSSKGTDIAEGGYYVYAFLDLNGNGRLDTGENYNGSTFNLWDPSGALTYNIQTGNIESRNPAMLKPNYYIDYFFAAELSFDLSYNIAA